MAAPAPAVYAGSLRGTAPEIFRGDRTAADTFKRDFSLYRRMNTQSDLMISPYLCCTVFLSLIKGPHVNNWVDTQLAQLIDKTERLHNPIDQHDEVLWTDLGTAFDRSFTDTNQKERAYNLI